MYLAYSALHSQAETPAVHSSPANHELQLRYQAYQSTCTKYSNYIAEIQKYFPGWRPSPPTP